MRPARWSLLWWVAYVVAAAGSNALLCLNPQVVWMATQVTIDADPIQLLCVIIAEGKREEKHECWLDAPNKGSLRMVFVLELAITSVVPLQSHAHSAFAYSPFEPEKTKALKEVGVSSGTVPEYGKASCPYLKNPKLGGDGVVSGLSILNKTAFLAKNDYLVLGKNGIVLRVKDNRTAETHF